ncbi:hypothetical protein FXF53_29765 [Micromonospora sp. WP24]|nr:hypothetical protein [Micromonospora sp. WP24]TYB91616.1 hypothetical protein FXF53_29765 [Micromonospora sp. WP24]
MLSRFPPQEGDAFAGGRRPVDEEVPEILVEEGQADVVALARRQASTVITAGVRRCTYHRVAA